MNAVLSLPPSVWQVTELLYPFIFIGQSRWTNDWWINWMRGWIGWMNGWVGG